MRRSALAAGAAAVLASAGAIAWLALPPSALGPGRVPTMEVALEHFTRRITAEGNLKSVKATPITPPRAGGEPRPMKIAWMIADGSAVTAGQVILRFDSTELERQLADGKADLASARAKLARERLEARTAEKGRTTAAALAAAELEKTERFQNKDVEIFSRHQVVESTIDAALSRAKMDHARDAEKIEKQLTRSKIGLIETELRKAELAVEEARAGLESLEVKAPHAGILVFKRDWNDHLPREGEQVWPGMTVAEIPILDEMEAEVFVLEADGGGLGRDIAARVVVEARPGVEYRARARHVDELAQPRIPGQPVRYFAVTLSLERTDGRAMKPGQRVRATLILDKEAALIVPRQAIAQREGQSVVYRQGGDRFTPVEVELGASTPGRVVIEKGLAAGDRIALRDPTLAPGEAAGPSQDSGRGGPHP
ncbi:MAG TPA: HlyD family efflux transporter periplasmic adaptor subunit [Candidatus Acidoferrum sp.]|nr:HlyD family efflux transporter periplasmic adaptor subunit [Candidatus Acidoferrum sp.]